MGYDFIAFANKTKKEYLKPYERFYSSISGMMSDWLLTKATYHLISEPHPYQKPCGDYGAILCGSWKNSEFHWISDYDEIYDGNESWNTDWQDITPDAFVMLLEFNEYEAWDLYEKITKDPTSLIFLGKTYEKTKSDLIAKPIEKVLGKNWRDWYYYALQYRGDSCKMKDWPEIET